MLGSPLDAVKPIQCEYVEIFGFTPRISRRSSTYQVQFRRDRVSIPAVVVDMIDAKLKECRCTVWSVMAHAHPDTAIR